MLTPHIILEENSLGVKKCILKNSLLSSPVLYELIEVFDQVLEDPPRLFIVEGGEDVFCKGLDLQELAAPHAAISELFLHMMQKLLHLPCVTASWVEGEASAEGFLFALATDVTLATKHAFFSLPQLQRGNIPVFSYSFLKAKLASSLLDEMALTGSSLRAERAYGLGWVHRLVEKSKKQASIEKLAAEIMQCPSQAVALFKAHCFSSKHLSELLQQSLSLHLASKK